MVLYHNLYLRHYVEHAYFGLSSSLCLFSSYSQLSLLWKYWDKISSQTPVNTKHWHYWSGSAQAVGVGTLVPHSVWPCDDDGLLHGVNCVFWEKRLFFVLKPCSWTQLLELYTFKWCTCMANSAKLLFWHFWHKSSYFSDCICKILVQNFNYIRSN